MHNIKLLSFRQKTCFGTFVKFLCLKLNLYCHANKLSSEIYLCVFFFAIMKYVYNYIETKPKKLIETKKLCFDRYIKYLY